MQALSNVRNHDQQNVEAPQNDTASSRGTYVLEVGEKGVDRLELSERSYGHLTTSLVEDLRLARPSVWPGAPLRMAVVAAGAGSQLPNLARLAGPNAHFTCSDISDEQLTLVQRKAAEMGRTDIRCERLDIEQRASTETYDVVQCRFVLVHLQQPKQALKHMWKMVAEEGLLLTEEHSISGIGVEPPAPCCERAKGWLKALGAERGVNFELGDALPQLFADSDVPLTDWRRQRVGFADGPQRRLLELSLREGAANYMEAGIASRADIDEVCDELFQLAQRPDTTVFLGFFSQAWAKRFSSPRAA